MRRHLRRAKRISGFAGVTAGMASLYVAHRELARARHDPALRDRWVRRWSDALLRLFAIEVRVVGAPPPRGPRGRLVVANHRSTIDVGVMLRIFGGRLVSRGDLATWPVVGPAARAVGTVFVDRESGPGGVYAIRTMSRLLRDGETVSVFAEGTTFADDEVRPFLPGGFVAAMGARAEVVPVGLAYGAGSDAAFLDEPFSEHLLRLAASPPSRVAVAIGAPMAAAPGARAAELAARAREAVQTLVREARAAL